MPTWKLLEKLVRLQKSPANDVANNNERAKYNQMAPPTNQYMAEIATAIAQNAVDIIKIAPPQVCLLA